jgi:hypothetical protein
MPIEYQLTELFLLSPLHFCFVANPSDLMKTLITISLIAIGLFVFTFLQLYSPIRTHFIQHSNRAMKGDLLPQPSVKGDLLPQPQYPAPSSPCTLEAHCRRV